MRHRAIVTGPTTRGVRTAGNMFQPQYAMVRSTPDSEFTDATYHLPAFYELWGLWGPEADRPFWARAATASRDFLQKVTRPATGLSPDYANLDGTLRGGGRDNFQYNARRTAMNWSVDWSWSAKDEREPRQSYPRLRGAIQSQSQIETLLWMVPPYSRVTACAPTLRTDTRRHTRGCAATGPCRGLAGTLRAAKCVIEFKPRTAQVPRVNLTRWADRDCRI